MKENINIENCKRCGAKIDPRTECCVNCGLHVSDYSETKKNPVLKIVLAVAAVIVVLLLAKGILNLIAAKFDVAPNDGYIEVVEELMDAVYVDTDMTKFISLMPEAIVQQKIDENFDGDEAAFQERMQEVYAELEGMTADAGSVTWKIDEELDMVGVQLKRYEEILEEESGVAIKLRSAKALDLTVSYTENGEPKEESMYVLLGLIDGEWYLVSFTQD